MQKKESWYQKMLTQTGQIADLLELESEQREMLRDYVLGIAKDQYCEGNKAGIKWLRGQMAGVNATD